MVTQTATEPRFKEQVEPPVNPEPIMRLATGFMAAKHLFAANELGIFEALGDSEATVEQLAARTGLTPRAARISADAMVALELLERRDDRYRNSRLSATFLAGLTTADLRPFLRFWDRISYPAWTKLAEALASGPPQEIFELDDELQEVVSAGIESILAGPAAALGRLYDFSRHTRLLDIGGGTGSWSIAVARSHPHLKATVAELDTVAEFARRRIEEAGLSSRLEAVACDVLTEPLPVGFDVFLIANVVHYWSPRTRRGAAADKGRGPGGSPPAAGRLLDRPDAHAAGCRGPHGGRVRGSPSGRRRLQRGRGPELALRIGMGLRRARAAGGTAEPRRSRGLLTVLVSFTPPMQLSRVAVRKRRRSLRRRS